MKQNCNKSFAFTLAEILIVVSIIGLVAEATIPVTVVNYQKKVTAVKLQKIYSELYQVFELAKIDYGEPVDWEYGTAFDGPSAAHFMNKYMVPYLKVAKNCETQSGCFGGRVYSLSNFLNSAYGDSPISAKLRTASGYFVGVTSGGTYVNINVIINPTKEKVVMGKDWFAFSIGAHEGAILSPHGIRYTREELLDPNTFMGCTKQRNDNSAGMHCSGLIMKDGWEIKEDYPWR